MQPSQPVRGVWRAVYLALAAIFLVLGLVGVVVPGLPTTPFLLLMSYFLIRCSPQLHGAVLEVPVIGTAIRNWEEKRGIERRVKLVACLMVLFAMGVAIVTMPQQTTTQALIGLLGAIGLIVIWWLPALE